MIWWDIHLGINTLGRTLTRHRLQSESYRYGGGGRNVPLSCHTLQCCTVSKIHKVKILRLAPICSYELEEE